jgi:hypothetical protein
MSKAERREEKRREEKRREEKKREEKRRKEKRNPLFLTPLRSRGQRRCGKRGLRERPAWHRLSLRFPAEAQRRGGHNEVACSARVRGAADALQESLSEGSLTEARRHGGQGNADIPRARADRESKAERGEEKRREEKRREEAESKGFCPCSTRQNWKACLRERISRRPSTKERRSTTYHASSRR